MTTEQVKETITLPKGVTATLDVTVLTLTGTKGSVSRNFIHPQIKIEINDGVVEFVTKKYTKNEKKIIKTNAAHVRNMIKGVVEGHEYKLKICSGHFPMNVSIKGNKLEVKNFIGEVVPRLMVFKEGVTAKLDGDFITITGIDKELTAQAAASVEQLTRRNGFDRRIFQDGIYLIEKDGKKLE